MFTDLALLYNKTLWSYHTYDIIALAHKQVDEWTEFTNVETEPNIHESLVYDRDSIIDQWWTFKNCLFINKQINKSLN